MFHAIPPVQRIEEVRDQVLGVEERQLDRPRPVAERLEQPRRVLPPRATQSGCGVELAAGRRGADADPQAARRPRRPRRGTAARASGATYGIAGRGAVDRVEHGGAVAHRARQHVLVDEPGHDVAEVGRRAASRPREGFRPTSPQALAGMRIDPPPSLPWASGTIPAATAAALPPLDPPVECPVFHGLRRRRRRRAARSSRGSRTRACSSCRRTRSRRCRKRVGEHRVLVLDPAGVAQERRPLVHRVAGRVAREVLQQHRHAAERPVGELAGRGLARLLEQRRDHGVELRVRPPRSARSRRRRARPAKPPRSGRARPGRWRRGSARSLIRCDPYGRATPDDLSSRGPLRLPTQPSTSSKVFAWTDAPPRTARRHRRLPHHGRHPARRRRPARSGSSSCPARGPVRLGRHHRQGRRDRPPARRRARRRRSRARRRGVIVGAAQPDGRGRLRVGRRGAHRHSTRADGRTRELERDVPRRLRGDPRGARRRRARRRVPARRSSTPARWPTRPATPPT